MKQMTLRISRLGIRKIAYLYVSLPVLCFTLFYMKSIIGLMFALCFAGALFFAWRSIKNDEDETDNIEISIFVFFVLAALAFFWTFLGGHGNHWNQSLDWDIRNAIYRDLIYGRWPVVYTRYEKALVYYIGYWLPAATATKVMAKLMPDTLTLREDFLFDIGNQFLWIWGAIGILILFFLVIAYVKPKDSNKLILAAVMLVFFSGLDVVGAVIQIVNTGRKFPLMHIEWWSPCMQFSSITTCLYWVFNQTVIPWIVMACLLMEKSVSNYVFLGVCALVSGPMPLLGIFTYMVFFAIEMFIQMHRKNRGIDFMKKAFSPGNILSLPMIPLMWLFFSCNDSVIRGASNNDGKAIFGLLSIAPMDGDYKQRVWLFLFLEAGVFLIPLALKYRKKTVYWATVLSILVSPFFTIGSGADFFMRFSVPAIFTMAVLTIRFLVGEDSTEKMSNVTPILTRVAEIVLVMALLIGAVTPISEKFRGYNTMLETGIVNKVQDEVKTIDSDEDLANFTAHDYENKLFFKMTGYNRLY